MVRITDKLLVSRAEHNDGHLPTLEEISLHQQKLEKIEYINRVCADLRILQFQVCMWASNTKFKKKVQAKNTREIK